MKHFLIALNFTLLVLSSLAQETYFEASGGKRTPRYDETVAFCKKLASTSPMIHFSSFGKSPQGRDLPLLIVDKKGLTTPKDIKESGNAVLLVQACIHSGESDGKDAGLMLLRDILSKPAYTSLLDHVTILFIPIFNVDGHERFGPYNRINQNGPEEMGWRTTAQNLNLNRDYLKADAPEMQAWLRLYNAWLPDFFIDCHVTDGADYQYVLTYALETNGDMDDRLSKWTEEVCEPYLVNQMKKNGYPIFPYVEFRRWHDPRSGLMCRVAPPMLSQGYCAIQNRPGLLIETHMLKPYKQRVEATYSMIRLVIELLNKERTSLKKLEADADTFTSSPEFRKTSLPVSWDESLTDSTMTDFLGFEYTIDTSDVSGGLWFRYDNTKPATWKIPMFRKNTPDRLVKLPEAYIIPAEWSIIIDRLKLHGVNVRYLEKDVAIRTSLLHFEQVKWQGRAYEGRVKVSYTLKDSLQEYTFPKGSAVVDMNQRTAMVIAHLLEPASPDSYASWGFFNSSMEIKEYFESYVMETEARKMMEANPELKKEFEKKKAEDPKFAQDPEAILWWFYSKSPWWDSHLNVYPVGRILERPMVDKLFN